MAWDGIRDIEREREAAGSGPVKTYKMSPEEMEDHLSRLEQKAPNKARYEKTIKEESQMKYRGNENSKTSLSHIKWFVDIAAPATPILKVSTYGLSFNGAAVKELGYETGQGLAFGLDSSRNRLVVKFDDHGLTLKKGSGSQGLRIMNKRLGRWMKENQIEAKKYALKRDPGLSVFYAELEKQG